MKVLLSQRRNGAEVCGLIGVTDQHVLSLVGGVRGIRTDQATRLKERKNTGLKKLVAAVELDKSILREAASGNF